MYFSFTLNLPGGQQGASVVVTEGSGLAEAPSRPLLP